MRHEEKFICSERQLFLLENRLKAVCKPDSHQIGDSYTIRSLYFDTVGDRFLEEGVQGVDNRSKFRIRIYNGADTMIRLEKKTSIGQLKCKDSCRLSRCDVEEILLGKTHSPLKAENKTLQEFRYLQAAEGLLPKVIVEYDRATYVSRTGDVRITFDRSIGASVQLKDFFAETLLTVPILPDGKNVLEVKYSGVLPGYLARLLDLGELQRVSFSKYGLCRNIIENNGRIEDYYEF